MANTHPFQELLKPAYQGCKDEILLQQQTTLRKLVGILGILLPLVLVLFLIITANFRQALPSISHYYFTRANSFFHIIVSLMAIFLLVYKGCNLVDYYVSSLAGIAALVVLLLPTSNLVGLHNGTFNQVAITQLPAESTVRHAVHFAAAGVFLLLLAYMSAFLFTKSKWPPHRRTKGKKVRNRMYRVCAVIMVLCIAAIATRVFGMLSPAQYEQHSLTFWLETLAIEAFGFSWLVKGEAIFTDEQFGETESASPS